MFELSEEIQSELSQAIADLTRRYDSEPSNTRAQLTVEYGGLPIYVDMGASIILFPSGELLTSPHDSRELIPTEPPFDTVSLVVGLDTFPWLKPLLPERASAAVDCSTCKGAGRVALEQSSNESSFICGTCAGLGWIHDS